MAKIRSELHQDVRGIVENAKVITDWKHYVRHHPWACMVGAAALGYLVVPKRLEILRPDPETLADLARTNRLVVNAQSEPRPRGGTTGAIFTFLATALMRGAMGYLGQQATWLMRGRADRLFR
jgi:hypothetical protein